jgi:PPOX class probable F420-dependent enzyme
MEAQLTPAVRAFLTTEPRFATIATINPDGSPHQVVVWYLVRGDRILLNSLEGRRWPANLRRDPRISLTVEDGLDYVTIAGLAAEEPDSALAQAEIAEMAHRYHDADEARALVAERFSSQSRVRFFVSPTRIETHGEID